MNLHVSQVRLKTTYSYEEVSLFAKAFSCTNSPNILIFLAKCGGVGCWIAPYVGEGSNILLLSIILYSLSPLWLMIQRRGGIYHNGLEGSVWYRVPGVRRSNRCILQGAWCPAGLIGVIYRVPPDLQIYRGCRGYVGVCLRGCSWVCRSNRCVLQGVRRTCRSNSCVLLQGARWTCMGVTCVFYLGCLGIRRSKMCTHGTGL